MNGVATARRLRSTLTDAERRLWSRLRNRQLARAKFRRQFPIGPFVADFACTECKLIVEADGGQHADNPADERRTAWLVEQGWRVLRFWNPDILTRTDDVLATILAALEQPEI
ncbi:endonuclease domain-containing protein [Azospirillum sp. A29]|uniref:endonuclease domain-containing protein n=1 Tax=Azospirillum sp. A29 TaxID=3160606 RepID=UPI00366AA5D0